MNLFCRIGLQYLVVPETHRISPVRILETSWEESGSSEMCEVEEQSDTKVDLAQPSFVIPPVCGVLLLCSTRLKETYNRISPTVQPRQLEGLTSVNISWSLLVVDASCSRPSVTPHEPESVHINVQK